MFYVTYIGGIPYLMQIQRSVSSHFMNQLKIYHSMPYKTWTGYMQTMMGFIKEDYNVPRIIIN